MDELLAKDPELNHYYQMQNNGFYRVKELSKDERIILKNKYNTIGFSALYFTDSRSRFQFYNLERLWSDIQTALHANIKVWHPATEPIAADELYRYLSGMEFDNKLDGKPADYDYRSVYAGLFHGKNGYICSRTEVMYDIKKFIETGK